MAEIDKLRDVAMKAKAFYEAHTCMLGYSPHLNEYGKSFEDLGRALLVAGYPPAQHCIDEHPASQYASALILEIADMIQEEQAEEEDDDEHNREQATDD